MINFAMQIKYRNLFKLIILALLGLTGTCLLLFIMGRHGAGITPDSVAYISVARNFAVSNEFLSFDGSHLVVQPPLFSILLAVIKKLTSIDPQISVGYVNAVLFGFLIYLSGLLLLKRLHSFTLVLLGTISVMISYAIVQASLMALSEPLFISFLLLFLYYSGEYQSKRNYASLILFSAAAAMACLTRYIGITIILSGIIYIVIWGKNYKEKLWHSLIFLLISILPIGLWIFRNYFFSTGLVGMRGASSYTLSENIRLFFNTIIPWFSPSVSIGNFFILIILMGIIWVFFGLNQAKSSKIEVIKLIGPSLLFVLIYSVLIIYSSTTTAYDPISDRLLSPICIPVIIILFFFSDKVLHWLRKSFHQKFITVLFIIGVVLLIRQPARITRHLIEDYQELSGWGYSAESWRNSETIKYLTQHEQLGKEYSLYSNEPEAVYILTNLKAKRSPAKTFYNSPQTYNIYPDPKDIWRNPENVCIIWFDKDNRDFLFSIDELKKNINMTEVAHLEDGEIYTFSSK